MWRTLVPEIVPSMSRTESTEGVTMKQRVVKRIIAAAALAAIATAGAVIPASSASADTTWPVSAKPHGNGK